ncbi:5-guanidino-2-oxopentanoate decarboxylase [Cognatishimia sp. F0-27]|uniref:5-guanidino-2-oxopentanoate decarboxylase n=1 Tax=Cognatishimia sp. F0-27 TaxID=2816855 RepID=UPI001D0C4034|nr:5-guanidino-2-oxopentanoate decarboxylase [Cognatishimia sp. F0-27]MCC1494074.1 5-guanidino-2-oxopentanoate decarboxylase [Cognatishimia sp. F0-27]
MSATHRPLGAQISHMLKSRGVSVVFGIPGVHNIEMYRGLEEAGLTHVLARHEQGAGFMADGYARASGAMGVCYLITGPGLLNSTTALGQAYSDSVPVLAIASCLDETAARKGQLHQMKDQRAAAETVCAWSETALTPDAAYSLVDRAFGEVASGRPRPRALHVPIAALGAPAPVFPAAPPKADPPRPSDSQIRAVVDRLLAAHRPLFIFGGGARGAASAIPRLLDQTGAAAFTTYAGRGLVPPDHPLLFGSFLARPDSADVIAEADLVIVVGSELSECDLWRTDLGHRSAMLRIDIDPAMLSGHAPDDLVVQGDAGALLQAVTVAIAARIDNRAPAWSAQQIVARRDVWRAAVAAERPGIPEICDVLRDALPDDAMIYSDMTQFAYAAKEIWDMPRPGHWHHPYGFGTLGYALPAAIGGAVARPGLPTVAILGDYGLQYTLPELGTAVELGLSLPILVWDNAELGEIKDAMIRAQIAPNAVVARNPDFIALAEAYGAKACTPETLQALARALSDALEAGRPTLIRMTPALVSLG